MINEITIDEITEGTNSLLGIGYFDEFMRASDALIGNQFKKRRISTGEFASVYLGTLQKALEEAVKLALGKQMAEAQAAKTIVETEKIQLDKDLVSAEIALKGAVKTNTVTENDLILAKIANMQCETSKCGEEKTLIINKANSEKANTDGSVIGIGSLLDYKNKLEKWRTATEKAQTDGSDVTPDSYQSAKIDKMRADATNEQAKRDKTLVEEGSLIACDTKLACARAEVEASQLLPAGIGVGKLDPSSVLGAKANLAKWQAATEEANTVDGVAQNGSLLDEQITKMKADANVSLAQYDPVSAGVVLGSVVDSKTKLMKAQMYTEMANTQKNTSYPIQTDSYLDAKIKYLKAQADKMNADKNSSVAQEALWTAQADTESCRKSMYCAQAGKYKAEYASTMTDIVDPVTGDITTLAETDLPANSPMGASAAYTLAQAKLLNIKATTEEQNKLLMQAKAATEGANTVLIGKKANTEISRQCLVVKQGNDLTAKKDLYTAQIKLYCKQGLHYDADSANKQAKLYVSMYNASVTQLPEDSSFYTATDAKTAVQASYTVPTNDPCAVVASTAVDTTCSGLPEATITPDPNVATGIGGLRL